jgi:hypothetical protein
VDLVRSAEYARVCTTVDAENDLLLAKWGAKNAAILASHRRECDEVKEANRRLLANCKAENASRWARYDLLRLEIAEESRQLTSAWEALKATRQAEHERACHEVDAKNRRLITNWEAANTPWVAEAKRWRDRFVNAEAEILRLESDLNRQRTESESRFRQRKDEASGIAARYNNRTKRDYEGELSRAKVDSKKIQLEEHLDKALIRQAKLKGITGDRILSLESFGIETARDVPLLNNQKVPGIGPVLSQRLLDWRDSLAASFRPKSTLPDSEKNRIASRFAPVMLPLGQSIQAAINDLDTIAMSHRAREADLLKALGVAVQNVAIAEAYVRAMNVA